MIIIQSFFDGRGLRGFFMKRKTFYVEGLGKFKYKSKALTRDKRIRRAQLLNRREKILLRVRRYNAKKLSQSLNNNNN
jgi:hypothetical protein